MLRSLVKRLMYLSGGLGLWHRVRNAHTLTVVMFHRILEPADPRWTTCDPDYTLPVPLLEASLRFFRRHYHVVSLEQVLQARRGGARLPRRALLISFDDGWADNVDHALPALERAGLPAVMFVVADVVGRSQPFFQERLVSAWRRGVLSLAELAAAIDPAAPPPPEHLDGLRPLITALEALDTEQRERVLAPFAAVLDDGLRHMVDVRELQRLRRGGVALGVHGKTHTRITRVADPAVELEGARQALEATLEQSGGAGEGTAAMSFPFGTHDAALADRARAGGYELVFTSVPVLNPTGGAGVGWLLGRSGFEAGTITDARGRFRPELLALDLFRRQRRRLA
jgi:peptidoglycan/xylan/chitin deacetylase (PgdA/CDA1 family)